VNKDVRIQSKASA